MPDYRVSFDAIYRLPGEGDNDASQTLTLALATVLVDAVFFVISAVQSAVQNQPGVTLFDVHLTVGQTRTANNIQNSVTGASIPNTISTGRGTATRIAQEAMASANLLFVGPASAV